MADIFFYLGYSSSLWSGRISFLSSYFFILVTPSSYLFITICNLGTLLSSFRIFPALISKLIVQYTQIFYPSEVGNYRSFGINNVRSNSRIMPLRILYRPYQRGQARLSVFFQTGNRFCKTNTFRLSTTFTFSISPSELRVSMIPFKLTCSPKQRTALVDLIRILIVPESLKQQNKLEYIVFSSQV